MPQLPLHHGPSRISRRKVAQKITLILVHDNLTLSHFTNSLQVHLFFFPKPAQKRIPPKDPLNTKANRTMDPKWQKWIQCLDCIPCCQVVRISACVLLCRRPKTKRWVGTRLVFHAETHGVLFQYPRSLIITTINHPSSQGHLALWSVTFVYVLGLEELEESVNGSSNRSSSMMACTLNDRVTQSELIHAYTSVKGLLDCTSHHLFVNPWGVQYMYKKQ